MKIFIGSLPACVNWRTNRIRRQPSQQSSDGPAAHVH
jgi:hypothetical protein